MPQSQQYFCPITTVKVLENLLRNRCWPTIFHIIRVTNKSECNVHKLNFSSHCQRIQIKKTKWSSDQSKSPSNQLHKCETNSKKGLGFLNYEMLKWLGLQYSLLFVVTFPTSTSLCALRTWKHYEISCALCSLGSIVCEVQFVEPFVVVCLCCFKNRSTELWCNLEAVNLLANLLL